MAQELSFKKLVASGNDFLFFFEQDLVNSGITKGDVQSRVPALCDRHFGVGADGVIVLAIVEPSQRLARWDFFNSDGSEAAMCGNAARCAGRLLSEILPEGGEIELLTSAGSVKLKAIGEDFTVQMPPLSGYRQLDLDIDGIAPYPLAYVNTGVPHCVVQLESQPDLVHWRSLAAILRRHPTFGEQGANVTLFWPAEQIVGAVTFERGVEDFTLACGTGAVAAALSFIQQCDHGQGPVSIAMPGGRLEVSFDRSLAVGYLTGGAEIVYRGSLIWRPRHEKV